MLGKIFVFIYRLLLYCLTAILAVCSAGFTVLFYIEGQVDIYMILIFLLAITFESLKVLLSIAYPYMKYRNLGMERNVKMTLNICLLLSILASIYFFLGSKQDISPATKIVTLFYQNFDFEAGRTQIAFMLNMSLSIMIEVLIIKIPQYATIFRFKPDRTKQEELFEVRGTFNKLIAIPKFIIYKKVDSMYQKHCKELIEQEEKQEEIKVEEVEKPTIEKKDFKLIKLESNPGLARDEEKESTNEEETESEDTSNFCQTKSIEDEEIENDVKKLRDIIEDNRDVDICPSVKALSELTGWTNGRLKNARKQLQDEGYLITKDLKTYICKYMEKEEGENVNDM